MKFCLTILLFFSVAVNATTYYVSRSSTASDANNGLDSANSWSTVAKLNAVTFQDNDIISFRGGDSINISTFRNFTNGMHLTSYGTGKAYLCGLKKITSFSQSGNIYTSTLTDAASNLNLVVIDAVPRIKARYPNNINTWLRFNDTTSTTTVLNTSETGTPDHTGYEIMVRSSNFTIDVTKVSSQSTGTLNLNSALTYTGIGGNGYAYQNNSSLLDSNYEWTDSSNGIFKVYLTSAKDVYYSNVDTLLRIKKKTGVVIENLDISGANQVAIQFDSCAAPTVINCYIHDCGDAAISGQKTNHAFITNTRIKSCLNHGIFLKGYSGNNHVDTCRFANIYYTTVDSVGMYPGMGKNAELSYQAVTLVGDSAKLYGDSIMHSGYNGMYMVGTGDSINYTYSDSVCLVLTDGSNFYSWIDGTGVGGGFVFAHNWDSGMVVSNNVFLHAIGNVSGTNPHSTYYAPPAANIYLDLNANNIKVEYNTLGYAYFTSLNIATNTKDTVRYNTIFNPSGRARTNASVQTADGMMFIKNIYYCGDSAYNTLNDFYQNTGMTVDSEYITGFGVNNLVHWSFVDYSFPQYVTNSGYDVHGGTNPTGAKNRTAILIYNAGLTDKDISLPNTYTDVYGGIYFTTVTLHAFESKLLFPYTHSFSKSNHFLIPH